MQILSLVVSEATIDDLLREAISALLSTGQRTSPTKGAALDLHAAHITLTDPRARLSRSEGRGRLFSCLGELCWYLSKSNDLDAVSYYIPAYKRFAEEGKIH